jgi:hypothetical protein
MPLFAIVSGMPTGRMFLCALELLALTALIAATRCANYEGVFIGGKIYFTDADCYARMTRVRLCAQRPGLVLRHHLFENFPEGTTPHTTAPLDYLILSLSLPLRLFAPNNIDLAGALSSPLLGLLGGWFLWWWSRRMEFRCRWVLLLLYAISPIVVHATELGRPDHQSLALVLVVVAVCAEWSWQHAPARGWAMLAGAAWGFSVWVSAYEPLILFIAFVTYTAVSRPTALIEPTRRAGWIVFIAIIGLALLIERRIPHLATLNATLQYNWLGTIGEMQSIPLVNRIWLQWCGYLILLLPVLMWSGWRRKTGPPGFLILFLLLTFALTMSQARWAYFFVAIFALTLPCLLESVPARPARWIAFVLSLWPMLKEWDHRIWANESETVLRAEQRREAMDLRALAGHMMSAEQHPFLAPWWLSPAIAYWSGQPGVAGSSHQSLDGIDETARFFLAASVSASPRQVLARHGVDWVVVCDSDRVLSNSSILLGSPTPQHPLCVTLDLSPSSAPSFLALVSQNQTGKLFQVANNR